MVKLTFLKHIKKTQKTFFVILLFYIYKKSQLDIIIKKERLQKKTQERYQNPSEETKSKKKSENVLVNEIEILQKMRKRLVKYRKNYSEVQKIKTD